MEVAVERVWPESRGEREPLLPSERLTLAEAIHGFTLGSAYVNHLDDVTGSIETGKLADLAVIDRDLFAPGRRTDRRGEGRAHDASAARSSSRTPRSGEPAPA